MRRIKSPDKETLLQLYVKEKRTCGEIASQFGVSRQTVSRWLKSYDIQKRVPCWASVLTKANLEKWYIEERKPSTEIARALGTNHRTILNYLQKYNIPIRARSEAAQLGHHTDKIDSDYIAKLYQEGKSESEIASIVGLSQTAVGKRLRKMGIETRGHANFGSKNGMYGRTHTPEARAKIRAANKHQFSKPGAREHHAILTCRQIQAGRTGKSYNKLEQAIASWLDKQDIKYQQQFRLGRFVFDFYIPDRNLLIEAQGRFWHADPRFYDPGRLSPIQRRNVQNDVKKAIYALRRGFAIAYFWEDDVYQGRLRLNFKNNPA